MERCFQIALDLSLIKDFSKQLDSEEHISMQKMFSTSKYHGINAWDALRLVSIGFTTRLVISKT